MANRYYDQFQATLEKFVVNLFAVINFGATGAPTLQQWNPTARTYSAATVSGSAGGSAGGTRGIRNVIRNSAGNYNIVLQDTYNRFLGLAYTFQNASAAAAPLLIAPSPNANLTSTLSSTAPYVNVIFLNTSGTATDPASGEQVLINITLGNASTL